jgi:hypothetical protein
MRLPPPRQRTLEAGRQRLVDHIWGAAGKPTSVPQNITLNYVDGGGIIAGYGPSVASVTRLIVDLPNGKTSEMWLVLPSAASSQKLLVWGSGHFTSGMTASIVFWFWALATGTPVLLIDMPAMGINERPAESYQNHDDVFNLTFPTGSSFLNPFIDPFIRGINYCEASLDVSEGVYVGGFSGGGWTTDIVAAVEPRITAAYPAAGSLPHNVRTVFELGDIEQFYIRYYYALCRELHLDAGNGTEAFVALYAMAAQGKRFRQILNEFDAETFWAGTHDGLDAHQTPTRPADILAYEAQVVNLLKATGDFAVHVDVGSNQHTFSPAARLFLQSDMGL